MYDDSIVKIAKRDNNNKRKYLVINEKQGKHIPVRADEALKMFGELADILKSEYGSEKLLVIGFAETATAIGETVAIKLDSYYMHTTRENIEGVEYLYFTESHSHATEQKLVKNDIDNVIGRVDRVIFVEDEVTTGNTIMSIVRLMRDTYGREINFSVASILNGMDAASRAVFDGNGIRLHYLVRTNHDSYTEIAERYKGDGIYVDAVTEPAQIKYREIFAPSYINARRLHRAADFKAVCERLSNDVILRLDIKKGERCLVLGTEEFMFPALLLAARIAENGAQPMCHATTRSPIEVSGESEYPLHKRFELRSVYEEDRRTFVYELEKYDRVVILTDAPRLAQAGLNSLINALNYCGNNDITLVRCGQDDVYIKSSYSADDVKILLKDITGLVLPQPTEEREKLIQSGRHYSEMLPIEYRPSEMYMEAYRQALKHYAKPVADAVAALAEKTVSRHKGNIVLISLARAGIPIGILLKRYIEKYLKANVSHYAISIIKGRGIDDNAMKYILNRHKAEELQFVDGWIGKGAILDELEKCVSAYEGVSGELAVVADPAGVTELCGTHEDILIPSSCLNCTVSGLISRTFLRGDIIGESDFHGAVYYGELADEDLSYDFINTIEKHFDFPPVSSKNDNCVISDKKINGIDEVKRIAKDFSVEDINLIKPGIGEATRVLLRRLPWKVLINEKDKNDEALTHLLRLAEEKQVSVEYYPLVNYKACGIIRKIAEM